MAVSRDYSGRSEDEIASNLIRTRGFVASGVIPRNKYFGVVGAGCLGWVEEEGMVRFGVWVGIAV